MANYDVVSEPDLGRSQMAWVCKYQDFRDADGRRRTKEWIVFWEDQSLSFFRESRQRRLYLESQGYWAWTEDGGVHLPQFSCCPARELPAINVEAHGSESWFRPLVVFMARGPEVDHCHRARLQFSTKA